jgi:hypothetical protein
MSFNIDAVKDYSDHPQGLEKVYQAALEASMDLPDDYIFIETGTRSGGSALAIMQALKDSASKRWFFTVDPYGDKPYKVGDDVTQLYYGEDHYRTAMKVLYNYAEENKLNFCHFRMLSLDWMDAFDRYQFWSGEKEMTPKFGFAYLDGDHDSGTVDAEYKWLSNHTFDVRVIVDDAHYLQPHTIELGVIKGDRLFINVPEVV